MDRRLVRQLWTLIEPLHAVLYYSPRAAHAAAALGYSVETRWPSYFAWRAAPLGAAEAALVSSVFYSFAPPMVVEHVPSVWSVAAPAEVLSARRAAVGACYRELLGPRLNDPALVEVARLARRIAEAAECGGRPLAAVNAAQRWPDEPHLTLWQAATVLREHRGDGHLMALQLAGLDPCEALVSFAAIGAAPADVFASRGWSSQEWEAATQRLAGRCLVDDGGVATEAGYRVRQLVEDRTDDLAAQPWATQSEDQLGRFAQLAGPIAGLIGASGLLPTTSTLGIRRQT